MRKIIAVLFFITLCSGANAMTIKDAIKLYPEIYNNDGLYDLVYTSASDDIKRQISITWSDKNSPNIELKKEDPKFFNEYHHSSFADINNKYGLNYVNIWISVIRNGGFDAPQIQKYYGTNGKMSDKLKSIKLIKPKHNALVSTDKMQGF